MAKQIILRITPPSAGAANTLAELLTATVSGLGEGGKAAMAGMGRTRKSDGGRDSMLILTAGPGVTDDQVGAVAEVASSYQGLFKVTAEVLEDGKTVAAPRAAAPAPVEAPADVDLPTLDADEPEGGDAEDEGGDEEVPPYTEWSKPDLQAECVSRGLKKGGTVAELVARLEANDTEDGSGDVAIEG